MTDNSRNLPIFEKTADMETVSSILNNFVLPSESKVPALNGLCIIDTTERKISNDDLGNIDDIIRRVSRPVRTEQCGILYCYSGTIKCRINMIEYYLHRNDMLFFRENCIMEYVVSDPSVCIVAIVADEMYRPVDVGMKDYLYFYEQMARTPLVHLTATECNSFLSTCRTIEHLIHSQKDAYTEPLVKAYMQVIYLLCSKFIYRHTPDEESTRLPRKMLILKEFFTLVNKYFSSHRDVAFYADKLCLAPKYASQVIRQASGKMMGEWIQERVILEAKLMLLDGNNNVQQIADALGFPSQSAFGKYFKKAVGLSATGFVAEHGKGRNRDSHNTYGI